MKMYRTIQHDIGGPEAKIIEVEVDKFNDKSVWINGNRRSKMSSYENYFETWKQAHDHIISLAQSAVERSKDRLHRDRSTLGQIESLKQPE